MRHLVREAYGEQHVRRVERARRARRARRGADALVVQQKEQALALDALKAHIYSAGQVVSHVAVELGVGYFGERGDYSVAHFNKFCRVLLHVRARFLERCRHGDYFGNIFGARALVPLLRAAVDKGYQAHAVAAIEHARALGPVELVGGEREHINIVVDYVDGDVTHGLDGVGMEGDLCLAADGAYLPYGLNGAYLVVGIHYGDEAGIGADGRLYLVGGDHAV